MGVDYDKCYACKYIGHSDYFHSGLMVFQSKKVFESCKNNDEIKKNILKTKSICEDCREKYITEIKIPEFYDIKTDKFEFENGYFNDKFYIIEKCKINKEY